MAPSCWGVGVGGRPRFPEVTLVGASGSAAMDDRVNAVSSWWEERL